MRKAHFPTFLVTLLFAAALGCSFSHSSDSSSDSSDHSSDSSTSSSGSSTSDNDDHDNDKNEHARYQRDVEQYTAAFLQAGGQGDASFLAGLGDVARNHGVSDWEADASTWEAIGRGIARSSATPAEQIAYQTAWTGGDAAKQDAVARGLRATQ
jgi:hypothetical protein